MGRSPLFSKDWISRPNTFNYTFSKVGPEFPVVVPDRSTIWFVGRFTTAEIMEDFLTRLDRCAEGAAWATGTSVRPEIVTAVHEKIPNEVLAQLMHESFMAVGAMPVTEAEQAFARDVQLNAAMNRPASCRRRSRRAPRIPV